MSAAAESNDLATLSAAAALRGFRSGQFSPVDLLESVMTRIQEDARRPQRQRINAVVQVLEQGMDSARHAADRWARGTDLEQVPLLGLPVATKEKHGIDGEPLSEGILARADHRADADHPVIRRIRAAGGVLHARTTSPELSCATVTHSGLWGVTRNPWNPELSPGGSSGGAGAALAAGFAPLATASDIAGSTRIPAGFTGTVGYKAPYGRIPGRPPLSADWYRGDGPMARTVEDVRLLYTVMAGVDPADHTTVPGPPVPAAQEAPESWLMGRRVGVSVTLGDYLVHPDVRQVLEELKDTLTRGGAEVHEVQLPWTSDHLRAVSMAHFGHLLLGGMRAATDGAPELADYTRRFMADAEAAASRMTLFETLSAEAKIQQELSEAMRRVDVLVAPVSATDGLRADASYLDGIDLAGPSGRSEHLTHYWQAHMTVPFNIANRCPVISTPAGFATNGLPVGVQWIGRPYDEPAVFAVAAAWESLSPWTGLAPAWA